MQSMRRQVCRALQLQVTETALAGQGTATHACLSLPTASQQPTSSTSSTTSTSSLRHAAHQAVRWLSSSPATCQEQQQQQRGCKIDVETAAERAIADKIAAGLKAHSVMVRDGSGGCGTMYHIQVVAQDFQGLNVTKQHQAVYKLLHDDITQWHGLQLHTSVPPAQD